MRLVALGVAAAIATAPAGVSAQGVPAPALAPGEVLLEVNAVGIARGRADKAVITIPLFARAQTEDAALAQVVELRGRVVAAATAAGLAPEDILWSRPEGSLGFVGNEFLAALTGADPETAAAPSAIASEMVVVTIRDIDRVDEVLAALRRVHSGAMSPVAWEVEDDAALLRQARDAAFARARADAESIARTAGMRVVRLLRISDRAASEGGAGWTVYAEALQRAAGGLDAGRPGDVERQVRLGVDFALAPR